MVYKICLQVFQLRGRDILHHCVNIPMKSWYKTPQKNISYSWHWYILQVVFMCYD